MPETAMGQHPKSYPVNIPIPTKIDHGGHLPKMVPLVLTHSQTTCHDRQTDPDRAPDLPVWGGKPPVCTLLTKVRVNPPPPPPDAVNRRRRPRGPQLRAVGPAARKPCRCPRPAAPSAGPGVSFVKMDGSNEKGAGPGETFDQTKRMGRAGGNSQSGRLKLLPFRANKKDSHMSHIAPKGSPP